MLAGSIFCSGYYNKLKYSFVILKMENFNILIFILTIKTVLATSALAYLHYICIIRRICHILLHGRYVQYFVESPTCVIYLTITATLILFTIWCKKRPLLHNHVVRRIGGLCCVSFLAKRKEYSDLSSG